MNIRFDRAKTTLSARMVPLLTTLIVLAGCTGPIPARVANTASMSPTQGVVKLEGFPANAASDASGLWIAEYTTGKVAHVWGVSQLQESTIPIGSPTALDPDCAPENESDPIGAWLQRRCDLPSGVAVAAGSAWVGRNDQRAVVRIDVKTGRRIATIPVGIRIFNIAATSSAVWAVSFEDNAIVRIDPRTNGVTVRQEMPHAPSGVVIANGSVWISTAGNGMVVRLDTNTGAVQAEIPVGAQPLPLAAAAGAVWVRCEQDNTVVRIDPSTNAVVATVPVGVFFGEDGTDSLVATPSGVWATGLNLQWVDATSNRVTRTLPVEGRPYAAGDGALWIVSLEGRVSRILP
jgi:YVTN family beta-propeller protein